MLSIRMQRLGRKGHAVYRVVVQDSRQTPTSGKYIALLGNYDPHTKTANLIKDKAEQYLKNGAQPSERVVKLFIAEKITLPAWVDQPSKQERKIRNPEKLRKNRPAEAKTEKAETTAEPEEAPAADEAPAVETSQPEAEPEAQETPEAEVETVADTSPEPAAEPDAEADEAEKTEVVAETTAESDTKPEENKA